MLLLHQVGSVKVGEVVRYRITYTPSQDRILPSPERLYVRIRNSSAVALRAAFVHGPYTLAVAAYPAHFDPNEKFENPHRYGVPEFEPMVKAGGSWECGLVVPDNIRQAAGVGSHGTFGKGPEHDHESASWVIEVASQVIFSTSAAVGYEVLVARDQKSLDLGSSLPVVNGQSQYPQPGKVSDHQQSVAAKDGHHPAQPRGVYSRAVKITVDDTASLWNTPRLPGWDDRGAARVEREKRGKDEPVESMVNSGDPETKEAEPQKQKKVHLVILTHGLHSNLGADMLFLKESIDATAKQAKIDARARKARERKSRRSTSANESEEQTEEETESSDQQREEDDDEEEEVIVRGFSGNATKTERGIKYLGKRLARYVLSITYPDQPFLPLGKEAHDALEQPVRDHHHGGELKAAHKHSTIQTNTEDARKDRYERAYRISSISFVGHSLGGLVQTYAVAYIQKHSPNFFDIIQPINFIALATPFLGLSNENPMYVKFALDFGLVGRTGKDLGLTWRAPTIARSGWGAIMGNLGESAHKKVYGESQPESKPLLRILPTGPAHRALRKFRNRTAYSNVVNDGIVPLRTSCLLFLDWHGLGRVDKARRDAGLVETMVGFGWAELTGTNMTNSRQRQLLSPGEPSSSGATTPRDGMDQVPQPSSGVMAEDDKASIKSVSSPQEDPGTPGEGNNGPLSGFFNLFKSNEPPKPHVTSQKDKRIFNRSQTPSVDSRGGSNNPTSADSETHAQPPKITAGQEFEEPGQMNAPPRTTFFESAGDLLNPKMPAVEYLIDPSKRPRTIFHDRVYHPTDIPPPPLKKRQTSSLMSRKSFNKATSGSQHSSASAASGGSSPYPSMRHEDSVESSNDYVSNHDHDHAKSSKEVIDTSGMRVEEKIARGYHRDLTWRKVLVKLEPDAHNNIFVRRMFVNAYGWPVIKHLVDAHFSDSAVARARDEQEHGGERARDMNQPPDEHGAETKGDSPVRIKASGSPPPPNPRVRAVGFANEPRSASEAREALDEVSDLPHDAEMAPPGSSGGESGSRPTSDRIESVAWSDRDWVDSDNEESDEDHVRSGGKDGEREEDGNIHQQQGNELEGGGRGGDAKENRLSGITAPQEWNWTEKIAGKGAKGTTK